MISILRKRSLRILISEKPEWEDAIRAGFHRSRHEVKFGPISADSFAQFDLVVPMEIKDLIRFNQRPELLIKNRIPWPSEEAFSLCHDKCKFNQALIDRGFGTLIPRMGTGLKFPYVLKKRTGTWGQECWLIRDPNEEGGILDKFSTPDYFRQEFIPGPREFATHILFAKGRIIKSLNIMYEFESGTPIKGQELPLYQIIRRCPYLGVFARILTSIGFQGLCCVNYKVARGVPYIFEINPRFGGSLSRYFFSFIRHLD